MQVEERKNKEKHVYRKKKVKASKAGKEEGKTIKNRETVQVNELVQRKERQVGRQVKRKES